MLNKNQKEVQTGSYRNNCDLCGAGNEYFETLFEKSGYHIVKCGNCGLYFTYEIPSKEELKNFYGKSYYEGEIYQSYSLLEDEKIRYYLRNLMYCENFSGGKKGNILEIGSATGIFLLCAEFLGYNATGVEISDYAADAAKKKNANVIKMDLEDLVNNKVFEKEYFDFVFLWDCIEHLTSPSRWLKYLNFCTKTGGLIVLNTLNVSSPTVKYLKNKWSQYLPPGHLFYFSLNTLKKYLYNSGFSVLKLKTDGPLFYDDLTGKSYLLGKLFSRGLVQKNTNKLNLGYAQFINAKKTRIA